MAATALKLPYLKQNKEELVHMFIATIPKEEGGIMVEINLTEDDFIPKGTPMSFDSTKSEEDYHTDLRKDSYYKGHFIKEFSTNPEWNPIS